MVEQWRQVAEAPLPKQRLPIFRAIGLDFRGRPSWVRLIDGRSPLHET